MRGLEKLRFVLDVIQDELDMAMPGQMCRLFPDSFLGKIEYHDLANIVAKLEYEKVLRIIESTVDQPRKDYFCIEILPKFQEYKSEIEHKLEEIECKGTGGFIYTRNTLFLNAKALLKNHQDSRPDRLFKTLWENKTIIRQGKAIKEGNRIPTKELTTAAGYESEQATMDRIGFFNQKLPSQKPNSAKIENDKGAGYLFILETDNEVKTIITE